MIDRLLNHRRRTLLFILWICFFISALGLGFIAFTDPNTEPAASSLPSESLNDRPVTEKESPVSSVDSDKNPVETVQSIQPTLEPETPAQPEPPPAIVNQPSDPPKPEKPQTTPEPVEPPTSVDVVTTTPEPLPDKICLAQPEPDLNSTHNSQPSLDCDDDQSVDLGDLPTSPPVATLNPTQLNYSLDLLQPPLDTSVNLDVDFLASQAKLSQPALEAYKASDPQVMNKDQLKSYCSNLVSSNDLGGVFGCYTQTTIRSNIYILGTNCRGLNANTVGHETLHAIYHNLSLSERNRINQLLKTYRNSVNPTKATELLENYFDKSEPVKVAELYAMLGTEVADIGLQELENHYNLYLQDRRFTINNNPYLNYKNNILIFLKVETAKLLEIQADLKATVAKLDDQRTFIETLELDAALDVNEVNRLKEAYNQLLGQYESSRLDYNGRIQRFNQVVNSYNKLIETGDCSG